MKKSIIYIFIVIFVLLIFNKDNKNDLERELGIAKVFYNSTNSVDEEFLKLAYKDFEKVSNAELTVELGSNVEIVPIKNFVPQIVAFKKENKNQYYIQFDESKILEISQKLSSKYSKYPINVRAVIHNNRVVFFKSEKGKVYNVEKLAKKIHYTLKNNKKYVKIEAETINPTYNAEDVKKVDSVLASVNTDVGNSTKERIQNLVVASNAINNIILMPKDVFSMNEVLGEFTYEKGYVDAPVIINGKLVNDIAGGVCQISSTLYNAVLYSELEVLERRNHSTKVNYLPYGFDATIVSGLIDFKFRNNTNNPIVILSDVTKDGKVVVSICGVEERPPNRKIEFEHEKVEDIVPESFEVLLDKTKESDFESIVTYPRTGYIYKVYKVEYIDNKEVSRTLINESVYKSRRGKVVVGEKMFDKYVKQ